ncbi:hypothetical protein Ciccas_011233, partial [Cichlidogyrus casuarinus]
MKSIIKICCTCQDKRHMMKELAEQLTDDQGQVPINGGHASCDKENCHSVEEHLIIAEHTNKVNARVPPPRPAEGPLLSPMEARPFKPEDQEILHRPSNPPTLAPSSAAS